MTRPVSLVPLPGSRWSLWDRIELRTAGLPAAHIAILFDELLAALVESGDLEKYRAAYEQAGEAVSAAVRRVAAEPRLREAVVWQNPTVFRDCVQKLVDGRAGRPAVRRRRELKVVRYLQRYTLKNDTIGFFGPVGWARFTAGGPAVAQRPGPDLLARRRVYFEHWAVDAVARRIAADPAMRPWLRPRRSAAVALSDGVVIRPHGAPIALTPAQAELLESCDGDRTLAELPALAEVLDDWMAAELLTLGLETRVEDEPEARLREQVLAVSDAALRDRMLAEIDALIAARDRVAAAAGDPDLLAGAMTALDATFEQVAGQAASRRPGEIYAGRRIVYEDTVRDMDVAFGPALVEALAAPLSLLLDSARWFVAEAAQAYRLRFDELFDALAPAGGQGEVPLAAFLAAATPDLAFSYRELPEPVAAVIPGFQRRWAAVLGEPAGARRHHVDSGHLAARVREAFPARALPWSSAVHHCPDLMIAAQSAEAVNRGDFLLVLGELHLTANTLDSRVDLQQCPDPALLTEADARDRRTPRIQPVPAKDSSTVNSRTYPPAMQHPDDVYWTVYSRHTGVDHDIVPGAGLLVRREQGRLVVRGQRGGWDLLEFLGEIIGAAVMNGFKPIALDGYRPRVTIDRLVIAREGWSFPPEALAWALCKDAADCYREVQAWRRAAGLPRRAFYRVASEDKPLFVDFSSVPLVRLLAAAVRASADEEPGAPVSFTEMLPDLGDHWLRDAEGAAYTSELRLVAVDRA